MRRRQPTFLDVFSYVVIVGCAAVALLEPVLRGVAWLALAAGWALGRAPWPGPWTPWGP